MWDPPPTDDPGLSSVVRFYDAYLAQSAEGANRVMFPGSTAAFGTSTVTIGSVTAPSGPTSSVAAARNRLQRVGAPASSVAVARDRLQRLPRRWSPLGIVEGGQESLSHRWLPLEVVEVRQECLPHRWPPLVDDRRS